MNNYKTIGILGGMGSAASANFYNRLIELSQSKYKASHDNDFPPILLYNLPLSDFDATGIVNAESVKNQLKFGIKKLEAGGCDFIVAPCNTVHAFYSEIQSWTNIPTLNMIELTVNKIKNQNYKSIGLLTSDYTTNYQLYSAKLNELGIKYLNIDNNEQELITGIIASVITGKQNEKDNAILQRMIQNLKSKGAEAIILGCTELPLALKQEVLNDPMLFNTINILAEEALKESFGY